MRTRAITGVLFIGMLTLVVINTYAAQSALDLSKPENIARLTNGTWEGTWEILTGQRHGTHGTVTMVFAFDPQGDEEHPFLRKTKTLGSSRADPHKFSTSRGKIEGNQLLFAGPTADISFRLLEEADGKLILRGESVGTMADVRLRETEFIMHNSEAAVVGSK
jgi:hypothetical protein